MDLIDTPSVRLEEYSTSRIGNAHSPTGSYALRSWQWSNPGYSAENRAQTKALGVAKPLGARKG